MAKNKGWPREPARHGLAAKGVKTSFEKAAAIGYRTAKADALSALHEDLRMLQDEEEDISKELDHEEFLEKEDMGGDDAEMMLLEQDLERVRNEIIGVERSIRVVMKGD